MRDKFLKNLNILIVEDEKETGLIIQQFLQGLCANAYLAYDGEEGYALFVQYPIDIILTDIAMPRLNGIEMSRRIRKENTEIPIIITTAYVDENFMLEAIELNITHYHIKPLKINKLLKQLEKIAKNLSLQKIIDEKNMLIQNVIDFQSNMIIVFQKGKRRFCNKSFLDFFGVATLEAFDKQYSIEKLLLNEQEVPFIDNIQTLDQKLCDKVKIRNTQEQIKTFQIKTSHTPLNRELIVSLSDISDLEERHHLMEEMATIDFLTKVNNRMKFLSLLEVVFAQAKRYAYPLSIVMFDIDFFKKVNDKYGHTVGDIVLREFAQEIVKNIRKSDQFARWGGEEFILFLTQTDKDQAISTVQKLRLAIENKTFSHNLAITCSIGISFLQASDCAYEPIINRADEALYNAKASGRNCVAIV
jgi:diguanylate cyclase (GGDEF)-like protein